MIIIRTSNSGSRTVGVGFSDKRSSLSQMQNTPEKFYNFVQIGKKFFQLSAFNKLEKCSIKTLSQTQLNNLFGATPLSRTTYSIMTFSITTLSIFTFTLTTISIITLSITIRDAPNSA
jgi:hypothetical protein